MLFALLFVIGRESQTFSPSKGKSKRRVSSPHPAAVGSERNTPEGAAAKRGVKISIDAPSPADPETKGTIQADK
jgi:hypothetical protein